MFIKKESEKEINRKTIRKKANNCERKRLKLTKKSTRKKKSKDN